MTPAEYQAARDAAKPWRRARLKRALKRGAKETAKNLAIIAALDAIAFLMCGYIGR